MKTKNFCNNILFFILSLSFTAVVALVPPLCFGTFKLPELPPLEAKSYLLMDYHTGDILVGKDYQNPVAPASITKLMTAYIAYHAIESGLIGIDDQVLISERAWRTNGSKTFIEAGKRVSVRNLISGMVIQSGNDASVALAEHIAGSVETFVDLMNEQATKLGMTQSHFTNVSGLPNENHYMSALDIAILARIIISSFPEYYKTYSERYFTFNGIKQKNRNRLLWYSSEVDGLKTGHTKSAGYCLAASAKKGNMRLITVVLNSSSLKKRNNGTMQLLNYGFRFYENVSLFTAGEKFAAARVWTGASDSVPVGVTEDITVTVPKHLKKQIHTEISIIEKIKAPIKKNQQMGTLSVFLQDELKEELPLVALEPNPRAGWLKRMKDEFILLF